MSTKSFVSPAKMALAVALKALKRGLAPAAGALRLDGARVLPGLSQWFRNPIGCAALFIPGDSTGFPPGTTDGSALPNTGIGGYARWPDALAAKIAASSLDITVRTHLWDGQNGNLYYQAPRLLKTASAGLRRAVLPGGSNLTLWLPKSNGNRLAPTEPFFVGGKVSAANWAPGNNLTLASDWDSAGNLAWSFGLFGDGRLWFSYSTDGTASLNRFSTVPMGLSNNAVKCIGVEVQPNNGSGGNTFTFLTSDDERNWTAFGTAVTNAGTLSLFPTTAPYQIGCRTIGGGTTSNWVGDVYSVQFRRGGRYGPMFLPAMPDQWRQHPTPGGSQDAPFYPMVGGPQLDIVVGAWPGKGLNDFDDSTNLPLLMPLLPYLGIIPNTGHNDQTYNTARSFADKMDRFIARVQHRASEAEIAPMTQNPTLRADGPAGNVNAVRDEHTLRMSWLPAWARSRGHGVIDSYQTFVDYVLGGVGPLSDLLDPAGAGTSQIIHPYAGGVTLQAQKVWDELGLGEAM